MSVLKRIFYTILILCLFSASCEKGKVHKTEVKKDNKLVLDNQIIKITRIFILRDKTSNSTDLAIQYKVQSKSNKHDVTLENSWDKGYNIIQNDKQLIKKTNVKHLNQYKNLLTNSHEKIEKGKTRKGMVIYTLNNAQKIVIQTKQLRKGTGLKEKDYPISELKTIDLNTNTRP